MLILAIDTSSIAASVAVLDENKLYGEFFTDFKLKHSEKIMIMIDDLFKNLRMKISDIDFFAISEGPGSFTGLRIGAATIKGFAQALDKPIVGVSTLKATAYLHKNFYGYICPVFDAQQKSLYSSIFKSDFDKIESDTDDCVITLDSLMGKINALDTPVLFCGDALLKYSEEIKLKSTKNDIYFADKISVMPRASAVGVLAFEEFKNGNIYSYEAFKPVYIRKAQAEKNFEVIY